MFVERLYLKPVGMSRLTVNLDQEFEDVLVPELHGDVQRRVTLQKN